MKIAIINQIIGHWSNNAHGLVHLKPDPDDHHLPHDPMANPNGCNGPELVLVEG